MRVHDPEEGVAIISKHPIVSSQTFTLTTWPDAEVYLLLCPQARPTPNAVPHSLLRFFCWALHPTRTRTSA